MTNSTTKKEGNTIYTLFFALIVIYFMLGFIFSDWMSSVSDTEEMSKNESTAYFWTNLVTWPLVLIFLAVSAVMTFILGTDIDDDDFDI